MNLIKFIQRIAIFFLLLNLQAAFADSLRDRAAGPESAPQQNGYVDNGAPSANAVALPKDVQVLRDIAYGDDKQQRMDVYLPPLVADAPVILMVHGGAWRGGDKSAASVVENKVARWVPQGIIFISVNYRTLPKADPLQQADDVARALAFAQSKAKSWGGNPAKFILIGYSAGAYLVDLLAADPARALALGAHPWLATISLDSGALNVVQIMTGKHHDFFNAAFGNDPTYWKTASPFHILSTTATPMLLVCSATRPEKPCLQAHSFATKATSLGIQTQVLEESMSHEQINQDLGLPGAYTAAVETYMSSLDASLMRALGPAPCE